MIFQFLLILQIFVNFNEANGNKPHGNSVELSANLTSTIAKMPIQKKEMEINSKQKEIKGKLNDQNLMAAPNKLNTEMLTEVQMAEQQEMHKCTHQCAMLKCPHKKGHHKGGGGCRRRRRRCRHRCRKGRGRRHGHRRGHHGK